MTAGVAERKALVAVALLTVLGGALRFADLGLQSLWIDEALTAWVLEPSPVETFDRLWDREATPPLFYALAWVWTRLFGEGDVALRSLSALLGTAAIPAVYLAARRLASVRAGLVAAALVATSPYLIWYSQEARSYALAMLLAALSLAFLARAATPRARRSDLLVWATTSALLVATHYLAAILIAGEAIWLLLRRGAARELIPPAAVLGAAGLLLAPLAWHQRSDGRTGWIDDLDFTARLDETPRFFVGGVGGAPGDGLGLAAGLLIATALVLLLLRGRGDERRGGLLTLALVAFGATVTLALAAVGLDYLFHRNLLVLWMPLAIAVASGFAAARGAGTVAAAALCAVFMASHIGIVRDEERHRADWESAVERLGRSERPRPVAVAPTYADTPLIHYGIPARTDLSDESVRSAEIAVIGEGIDTGRLEPGRRIGPFRVVQRNVHQRITTAVLRAAQPKTVELGTIHRAGNLGAPQMNVLLDPGRD